MKKIALALVVAAAIVGCSKNPEKVLPSKDGVWNAKMKNTTVVLGITSVDSTTGTVTFDGDKYTAISAKSALNIPADTTSGTWSYDDNTKVLKMISGGDTIPYTVSNAERKSQTWTYTQSATGISYTSVVNISR